jgi:hypothetical protein
MRFGDAQPESVLGQGATEGSASQEMPNIKKQSMTSNVLSASSNPYDDMEERQKKWLHEWLDQVEKAAERHLKK